MDKTVYETLRPYCATARETAILDGVIQEPRQEDAAKVLGLGLRTLKTYLAKLRDRKEKGDFRVYIDSESKVPNSFNVRKYHEMKTIDPDTGKETLRVRNISYEPKKEEQYKLLEEALKELAEDFSSTYTSIPLETTPTDKLLTYYNLNDLHLGALMYKKETGDRDYDLDVAKRLLYGMMEYLVEVSPSTEECIIADLGDMTEMDDYKNATPHSGNQLDVDGRYSKVLMVAARAMVHLIEVTLRKHKTVRFINVEGNHDVTTALAVRIAVMMRFENEPRVIVDVEPMPIKYFKFGTTLLGFAHGDGLTMQRAGEVMAVDNESEFSNTRNRYFHFGHIHKDKVIDGAICKAESHRNIAPLNHWAAHKGFRRQAGTLKSIVYCPKFGERSRQTCNVEFVEDVL